MDKTEIKSTLLVAIHEKIETVQNRMDELRSDLTSESKNTSGDKHETGRAMIQLEMENLGKQFDTWQQMANQAEGIPTNEFFKIQVGSLFEMENLWYYVSVSLGKLVLKDQSIMCISPSSPLAQLVLGMTENSQFTMNGATKKVNKVL